MVRKGKVKIEKKMKVDTDVYLLDRYTLDIVEKTFDNYSEVLIKRLSFENGVVQGGEETIVNGENESMWRPFPNDTVDNILNSYSPTSIEWLEVMTEI